MMIEYIYIYMYEAQFGERIMNKPKKKGMP